MFTKKEMKDSEEVKPAEKNQPVVEKKVNKGPSQKEVVYARVMELVKEKNIQVKTNQALKDSLTPEILSTLYDRVCKDFKDGKGKLKDSPLNKEKLEDDKKMRVYVIGLCSNWLRRDPRLSGKEASKA